MKFTGERFMTSETGRIRLEHYHRYSILESCVQSKEVLDVACGEGYGSFLLSNNASTVVGVDISAESIQHAETNSSS
jgi:2-polyprenyl-3-methyl-5-hydroxy-6-metoxy-1,4-benzoquinol methylase